MVDLRLTLPQTSHFPDHRIPHRAVLLQLAQQFLQLPDDFSTPTRASTTVSINPATPSTPQGRRQSAPAPPLPVPARRANCHAVLEPPAQRRPGNAASDSDDTRRACAVGSRLEAGAKGPLVAVGQAGELLAADRAAGRVGVGLGLGADFHGLTLPLLSLELHLGLQMAEVLIAGGDEFLGGCF
jgi:hypothetical protein